ncbi:hypothetical protein LTR56_005616 [Elasticomyces elasticus]|nr:hypothetical protein LTR56_005616 [Elasticomyces elasticus]KAK3663997.1 hypothetical protein LTR22_005217 [Elasticomyces elasticus]KAK4927357.1 hypothetical protein LTR49_005762 [Elasticomyces elasticus]KAK5763322.1 hypothetical protein LTS12_006497 [Elasticomyces elasticus]
MATIRVNHRTSSIKATRGKAPQKACQPTKEPPEAPKSLIVLQRALDDRAARTAVRRAPLLTSAINHIDIDDIQMFADFFEKYSPASAWRNVTYLGTMMEMVPTTALLKRAKRTIGLTHLAAVSKDERLAREARISYARLLGQLQFQIAFPVKTASDDETREVAASIALMTHLSDPIVGSTQTDDGWVVHLLGAQRLLSAYGPSRMNTLGRLNQGLLRHFLANGFYLALAKRKAWDIDTSWIQHMPSKGWTTCVTAFCKLAELLETLDTALANQWDTSEMLELVARLDDMERHGSNLFPEITRPDTMDVSSAGSLSADVEEHCVMTGSTAFPELFVVMSPDHPACHLFVVPTQLLLITACSRLRIWHFRPDVLAAVSEREQRNAKQHVYLLARDLCMWALSFTHSSSLVHTQWLRFCLTLARNVFEQQSALPELGWCDGCLIANQLRLERLRATCIPTLCKLEDITPGLAEAGRYKSKFDPNAFIVRSTSGCPLRLTQ